MTDRTFKTIPEAHEWIVSHLIKGGTPVTITKPDRVFEMLEDLVIVLRIEDPMRQPMRSEGNPSGPLFQEKYKSEVTEITEPDPDPIKNFTYYYGNRIFDFPYVYECDIIRGNGEGGGINQVNCMVDALVKDVQSRQAVAVLWHPELDTWSGDPPCLNFLQVIVREGKMHMIALFRSNDMLSAWGDNAYALAHLQKKIYEQYVSSLLTIGARTEDITVEPGMLITISVSAHLYDIADSDNLKRMKRVLYSKGLI